MRGDIYNARTPHTPQYKARGISQYWAGGVCVIYIRASFKQVNCKFTTQEGPVVNASWLGRQKFIKPNPSNVTFATCGTVCQHAGHGCDTGVAPAVGTHHAPVSWPRTWATRCVCQSGTRRPGAGYPGGIGSFFASFSSLFPTPTSAVTHKLPLIERAIRLKPRTSAVYVIPVVNPKLIARTFASQTEESTPWLKSPLNRCPLPTAATSERRLSSLTVR
ncbi:hypothetical protein ETAA8_40610 [Anatilimnocola aggregata]|uniref:Uncharacterized protein n=1 Tax=Anatilimnocola aggregata TaxID=2528021 RepID=A0A517YFE4_9BACT|nr:hypothetical protein ETAA8_40610 [Anatilimnocola aggregata]